MFACINSTNLGLKSCLVFSQLFVSKVLNYIDPKHTQSVIANFIVVVTPVVPSLNKRATWNATAKEYVYLTRLWCVYARGQRDYTSAPFDKVTRRPYGSVYDNVTKMFVVFSRTQAYCAYLISFQWRSSTHYNPRACVCRYRSV